MRGCCVLGCQPGSRSWPVGLIPTLVVSCSMAVLLRIRACTCAVSFMLNFVSCLLDSNFIFSFCGCSTEYSNAVSQSVWCILLPIHISLCIPVTLTIRSVFGVATLIAYVFTFVWIPSGATFCSETPVLARIQRPERKLRETT